MKHKTYNQKTAVYVQQSQVDSGKVGISNHDAINKAELTGLACALRAMYTHIATDSTYSLSQTQKRLLIPESHKKNTHVKPFQQIVSMI